MYSQVLGLLCKELKNKDSCRLAKVARKVYSEQRDIQIVDGYIVKTDSALWEGEVTY